MGFRYFLLISYTIVFLFITEYNELYAQERSLKVMGVAEYNMTPLTGAKVTLFRGTTNIKTIVTGSDGGFRFDMDLNSKYTITVEKSGLLGKRITFDTEIPDDAAGKWVVEFGMVLFEGCEGVNTSVLNEPVDIIKYSKNKAEFISDEGYASNIKNRLITLAADIDQCRNKEFLETVEQADKLYNSKEYDKAKAKYEEALKIRPDDRYSQRRVEDINNKNGEGLQVTKQYNELIKQADALFAQKKYPEAKLKYNDARKLMPQNAYPGEQIATITEIQEKQQITDKAVADKENAYTSLIAKANAAYSAKHYVSALNYYQEASAIKPESEFPKQKVNELQPLLTQQKKDQQQTDADTKAYNEAIASAQSALQAKDLTGAKQYFDRALMINPNASLPKEKIKEIDQAIELKKKEQLAVNKQEKEKQIASALDEGDKFLDLKDFDAAEAAYQKALALNPTDEYAKQKLDKIKSFRMTEQVQKQKQLEKQYTESVSLGDKMASTSSYEQAIAAYKQALLQKPDDLTVKNKLSDAEKKLAEKQQLEATDVKNKKDYDLLIADGNQLFTSKKYSEAKTSFQKALTLYPDQTISRTKIQEIDAILADQSKAQQLKTKQEELIKKADGLFIQKEYAQAKTSYQEALSLNSADIHAKNRIAEVDRLIAENEKILAGQQAKDKQYDQMINQADVLLTKGNLSESKSYYQKALEVKSAETYPKTQIAKIDAQVKQEEEKKINDYKNLLKQADNLFTLKDYTGAKTVYQQALSDNANDVYVKNRIAEIDRLIAENDKALTDQKAKDKQYEQLIIQADALLAQGNLSESKSVYQRALGIKSAETYPKTQIAKIDSQVKQEEEKKINEYKDLVKKADNLFTSKDYAGAKGMYQQALSANANDVYVKNRIAEIDRLIAEIDKALADQKAKDKQYEQLIIQADALLAQGNLSESKSVYQRALGIKSAETYPKTQIAKIDSQVKQEEEKKINEYKDLVKKADNLFTSKDYAGAKGIYQQALSANANDVYVKNRIAEIVRIENETDKKIADEKLKEQQYKTAIEQADKLYAQNLLLESKSSYEKALGVKSGETYPLSQIQKINEQLKQAEEKKQAKLAFEKEYADLIAKADKAYDTRDYETAKICYRKALEMRSTDTYPQQKLNKIADYERLLAQEQAAKKTTTTSASKTTSSSPSKTLATLSFKNDSEREKYLKNLMAQYPAGVTLEVYKEQTKTTQRFIVIREGTAREFRMVKFNWGGIDYSLNGIPITGQYFKTQIETRKDEYFQQIEK